MPQVYNTARSAIADEHLQKVIKDLHNPFPKPSGLFNSDKVFKAFGVKAMHYSRDPSKNEAIQKYDRNIDSFYKTFLKTNIEKPSSVEHTYSGNAGPLPEHSDTKEKEEGLGTEEGKDTESVKEEGGSDNEGSVKGTPVGKSERLVELPTESLSSEDFNEGANGAIQKARFLKTIDSGFSIEVFKSGTKGTKNSFRIVVGTKAEKAEIVAHYKSVVKQSDFKPHSNTGKLLTSLASGNNIVIRAGAVTKEITKASTTSATTAVKKALVSSARMELNIKGLTRPGTAGPKGTYASTVSPEAFKEATEKGEYEMGTTAKERRHLKVKKGNVGGGGT